jgi:Fe-S cluster biogenesis protein NfuA
MNLPVVITNEKTAEGAREQIAKILPIVTSHGGGVDILKATDDELVLGLSGHCAGCPIAPMTYGVVLNKFLKEAMPHLKSIKYVDLT